MARESIAMGPDEIRSFLAEVDWLVLTTLDEDGGPRGSLCSAMLDGEMLLIAVPEASDAARDIARDPRVCVSMDAYPTYYEIKGLSVHGVAAGCPRPDGLGDAASTAYALGLEDVVSFDFAKIRNQY